MVKSTKTDKCFDFTGKSTDTKPYGNNVSNGNVDYEIAQGSTLFEINTGDVYMYYIVDTNGVKTGEWNKI